MIKRLHFLCALATLAGCGVRGPAKPNGVPERVISLAPDITETLYALGLGDKLVGATTWCVYPDAAKEIPRVGGFGQYNFEAIVSLKPDLVILHHKYDAEKTRLAGLGIPYLETKTEHLNDLMESIRLIGEACGAEEETEALLSKIKKASEPAANKTETRPRVLITFGGGATTLDQIHAFGADCLHNDLLERAGGANAIENKLAFSTLSKEAVIRLNPDVIIQLAPGTKAPADPAANWRELSGVAAVQNKRVHVLTGDHTCIPGPRVIQILNDFERILDQHE